MTSSNGKGKVVLAYSGGLGYLVHPQVAHRSGLRGRRLYRQCRAGRRFRGSRAQGDRHRRLQGYIEDLRAQFVTDFIFPAIKANAIYEGRYLLGTSLARPCIARRHIEIARLEGCKAVSHGSTGKGNDQVRFELAFYALAPDMHIIAPWRIPEFLTQFKGRPDLIAYAEANNIPITATTAKPYSMDDNLYHISYESGVLEDPRQAPTKDMFRWTRAPEDAEATPEEIEVHFKDGVP